jgi:hypothetical protein
MDRQEIALKSSQAAAGVALVALAVAIPAAVSAQLGYFAIADDVARAASVVAILGVVVGVAGQVAENHFAGGAERDSHVVRWLDLDPDEHPGVRDTEVENR